MQSFLRRTIYAAVVPALVVGGIAVAQGSGNGSGQKTSKRSAQGARWHFRGPGGPGGPGGPPGLLGIKRDLTYAEIHAQENGKDVVYRIDRGKIKSVGSDSLTITENNGSDVTIPVNADTRVFTFDKGPDAKLSDLAQGQEVTVERKEGQPAGSILQAPKKGQIKRGAPPFDRDHGPPGGAPPFGP
jgi:hypothetical protein